MTDPAPFDPNRYALPEASRARIRILLAMLTREHRACRSCGRMIWIIKTDKGAMPVTDDGVTHFADCPNAAQHRRPR